MKQLQQRITTAKLLVLIGALFLSPLVMTHRAESEEKKLTSAGIFYGYVYFLHPDGYYFEARPYDPKQKMHRFYVDKKTVFTVDQKRANYRQLYVGDKVAVRFFGEGDVLVADAIFVVFGEYKYENYVKKRAREPKQSSEGQKKSGGH